MGIVVTVFMLLGLLLVSPFCFFSLKRYREKQGLVTFIGFGLLLSGLWNTLWFGLSNPLIFWGQAALVSGVFMVAVACLIIGSHYKGNEKVLGFFRSISRRLESLRLLLILGLLASFLLYLITLIRLNLGYPILG